ncbi:Rieske 2Fe-2S domain-containing protein [Methylobacter luteus]|uniref:Rieske 2Fe-2S domain-containing protein n=1 Tax=Methylobacter luteus TaxID=415 RepID=UPI000412F121|nr:Rieske 2Fe-2S domain-containing protein [Methylobacter luteus]
MVPPLLGHAHGEQVLLTRQGDELFVIGNICTHYDAPLGGGLLVQDTGCCSWHHACFNLRTGEAGAPWRWTRVPAGAWSSRGTVHVREKLESIRKQLSALLIDITGFIVIVGGGDAAPGGLR